MPVTEKTLESSLPLEDMGPEDNHKDQDVFVDDAANIEKRAVVQEGVQKSIDGYIEAGLELDDDDAEKIINAASELADEFDLEDSFFEEPQRVAMFLPIANEYAALEDSEAENLETGKYTAHKEFIANYLVLLAGDYSPYKNLISAGQEIEVSEAAKRNIYDRYTNQQVSSELLDFIDQNGLLDEVRSSMGISVNDNEVPFNLRVMNIDGAEKYGGGSQNCFGMLPGYEHFVPENITGDEFLKADDEYQDVEESFKKYENGLISNGRSFASALGRNFDAISPAWVEYIDGEPQLCIPLPVAEKIVYRDEQRSEHYNEKERDRDIAILRHEYVHTQQMLTVDGRPELGIALEELRAEHFSGDRHGYTDIKRHFLYLSMLDNNNFNPKKIFNDYNADNPYSPTDFYQQLGAEIGLSGVLEYIVATPGNYVEDQKEGSLQNSINDYVGGLDGIQEKIWNRAMAAGDGEEIQARILKIANKISERIDPESYFSYGGNTYLARKFTEIWKNSLKDKH